MRSSRRTRLLLTLPSLLLPAACSGKDAAESVATTRPARPMTEYVDAGGATTPPPSVQAPLDSLDAGRLESAEGENASPSTRQSGATCTQHSQCAEGAFCRSELEHCGAAGTCQTLASACPDTGETACGCDGFSYKNGCTAVSLGVSIDHFGPCIDGDGGVPVPVVTPCSNLSDCGSGQECDPRGLPQERFGVHGICRDRSELGCNANIRICGDDNDFYDECTALLRGITAVSDESRCSTPEPCVIDGGVIPDGQPVAPRGCNQCWCSDGDIACHLVGC